MSASTGSQDGAEYQRRYLVVRPQVLTGRAAAIINQAYLYARGGWTVRIRRTFLLESATGLRETPSKLALKGPRVGAVRRKNEWVISTDWASEIFRTAPHKIFLRRYHMSTSAGPCDVDEFFFDNAGLVIAEFAFIGATAEIEVPDWCGREVTGDRRFDNENLAIHPFSAWGASNRGS